MVNESKTLPLIGTILASARAAVHINDGSCILMVEKPFDLAYEYIFIAEAFSIRGSQLFKNEFSLSHVYNPVYNIQCMRNLNIFQEFFILWPPLLFQVNLFYVF